MPKLKAQRVQNQLYFCTNEEPVMRKKNVFPGY